jgi:hypothetical protein
MRDRASFFDKIGSLRLKAKYYPKEFQEEMEGKEKDSPQYRRYWCLSEAIIKAREQTTLRLHKDIISKMKWHIWEKNARDIGKAS